MLITIQFNFRIEKPTKLGYYYSGGLAGFTIWAINSPSQYSRLKYFGLFNAKKFLITSMLSISSLRCIYFGAYASIKNYTIQNYHNWNLYYSIFASSMATLGMKVAQIPFRNYRTQNYYTFGFLGEWIPFVGPITKFVSIFFRLPKPLSPIQLALNRVNIFQRGLFSNL